MCVYACACVCVCVCVRVCVCLRLLIFSTIRILFGGLSLCPGNITAYSKTSNNTFSASPVLHDVSMLTNWQHNS